MVKLTTKEERMVHNALRCVIVLAEGGSRECADPTTDVDTVENFKQLHRELQRETR